MKDKYLTILVAIAVLFGGGYFVYTEYLHPSCIKRVMAERHTDEAVARNECKGQE